MLEYTDNDIARFHGKVDRRGDDECWPWIGARSKQGYGNFLLASHTIGAHRMALAVEQGIGVPDGRMEIDHTCENEPCCNPSHLQWVPREGRINTVLHNERRFGERTHCANGHPWTEQNVYRRGKYKGCRPCRSAAATRSHRRVRS